jgi:sigma-B regulation protein RsbU (phosphoserine phosphatase)
MAGRIEELMLETAQKARMEKELETAQQVQKTLFPREGFAHPALQVAGRTIPATECAGDWWSYRKVGDKLVVVIGDVTGHGVSAALVTAAAHGAFTLVMRDCERTGRAPEIAALLSDMNAAIRAASEGSSTMTLLGTILDLATGELEYVNAAHRPLYLERAGKVQPMMEAMTPALGSADEPAMPVPGRLALEPGDALLWFTDGLVECPNAEGRTLSTARVAKLLTRLGASHAEAGSLCKALVDESVSFLGEAFSERPDDISVIIGRVPATAGFRRSGQSRAA